mmetsp:Transcript_26463/g.30368  ORF Transcript_26463/g.30368 Transcript_26463/m.30368 type:complete len:203 (+) Transcript_26463:290-898(+)
MRGRTRSQTRSQQEKTKSSSPSPSRSKSKKPGRKSALAKKRSPRPVKSAPKLVITSPEDEETLLLTRVKTMKDISVSQEEDDDESEQMDSDVPQLASRKRKPAKTTEALGAKSSTSKRLNRGKGKSATAEKKIDLSTPKKSSSKKKPTTKKSKIPDDSDDDDDSPKSPASGQKITKRTKKSSKIRVDAMEISPCIRVSYAGG